VNRLAVLLLCMGFLSAQAEEDTLEKTIASRLGTLGVGAFQRDYLNDAFETDKGLIPAIVLGITLDNPTDAWLAWGQLMLGLGNSTSNGTTPAGSAVNGSGFGIYVMPEGQVAYRLLQGATVELQVYGGLTNFSAYRKAGGRYWVLETNAALKAGIRLAAILGQWRLALIAGPNLSLFSTSTHYPSDILFSAAFTYRPAFGFNVEIPIDYQFENSNYGIRVLPWFSCLARGHSFPSTFSTTTADMTVSLPSDRLYQYGVTVSGTMSF